MSEQEINTKHDSHFELDLSKFQLPSVIRDLDDYDRSVIALNNSLKGHKILLLISGGIAAYKTPGLIRMLRSFGAEVDVRLTESATHFIGEKSIEWAAANGKVSSLTQLSGEVEHLDQYSAYLVAPATYNFINGMAQGRGDTPAFATMASALGRVSRGKAKLLILPCMNGDMCNPILKSSMRNLKELGVNIIAPRVDREKLEYPGSEYIAVALARQLSNSPLKGQKLILTGGPTPVAIDDVRRITNIFKGRLGLEIAKELVLRGANPRFFLGGSLGIPSYLEKFTTRYKDFEEYKELVLRAALGESTFKFAILSSAVADYKPSSVHQGKIASKSSELILPPLVPTEKVVELLNQRVPSIAIVSFKLMSRISEAELLSEARARLSKHSELVIANRLEDCSPSSQTVYLVSEGQEKKITGSKRVVAAAIVDKLESLVLNLNN